MITVSATTEQSTSNSEKIHTNISQATIAVEEVSKQAQSTSQLAKKLNGMVLKVKI